MICKILVPKSSKQLFLLEAPKGLTSLATITKAMSEEARERRRWQRDDESRGASVSSVDGDVADGIRPSHCERGDVDT